MKALSLTQPWATLVALGAKRYETRGWRTGYRGALAIHATKEFPRWARWHCFEEPFATVLRTHLGGDDPDTLQHFGVIVAVARLVDIVRTTEVYEDLDKQERAFGDYTPGRYAWRLEDVRGLAEPIPCRGMQGVWPVPQDVLCRINEQMVVEAVR